MCVECVMKGVPDDECIFTPVHIPVTEILANVQSSTDFGPFPEGDAERAAFWLNIITEKAADSGFGHLIDSILKEGWADDSYVGYSRKHARINEGHHRLVAAILLGHDTVPCLPYGRDALSPSGRNISAHWSGNPDPILINV